MPVNLHSSRVEQRLPVKKEHCRRVARLLGLADVRAVEVLEHVVGEAEVPLARRVVAVAVQPDLGAVLGLVAVDVEVHLGVGDGGDPARSLLELLCCLKVVLCVGLPVLAAAVPQRDDAPASAIVGRAHHVSCELLALRGVVRVGHEAAAVVVDDVVLVLAGLADAGVGDGEHVVLVHVVEPAHCCQPTV